MSLPSGWEGRSNTVTEEQAMQGKLMADRFTSNAYATMGDNVLRKTDDEIASFYLKGQGTGQDAVGGASAGQAPTVPDPVPMAAPPSGWGERQRMQEAQADAIQKEEQAKAASSSGVALVRVATFALEQMAVALETNTEKLPDDIRAEFATALGRAMQAAAKSR